MLHVTFGLVKALAGLGRDAYSKVAGVVTDSSCNSHMAVCMAACTTGTTGIRGPAAIVVSPNIGPGNNLWRFTGLHVASSVHVSSASLFFLSEEIAL